MRHKPADVPYRWLDVEAAERRYAVLTDQVVAAKKKLRQQEDEMAALATTLNGYRDFQNPGTPGPPPSGKESRR